MLTYLILNSSTLQKLDVDLPDIFIEDKLLKHKIVENKSEFNVALLFDNAETDIQLIFDRIKEQIFGIDKTLIDAAANSEKRILQTIGNLKSKAEKADERKHDTVINQINKVRNILYPNNTLQERVVNFSYFTNKYGIDIIKWLFNQIIINKFEHQIIEI